MKFHLTHLTLAAAVALGFGALAGSQRSTASEKKYDQVAATPGHGDELVK